MPKRYYCAYCCKSFQDTPRNRKRHLSGVSHQRLKQHHYDSIGGFMHYDVIQYWLIRVDGDLCMLGQCKVVAAQDVGEEG